MIKISRVVGRIKLKDDDLDDEGEPEKNGEGNDPLLPEDQELVDSDEPVYKPKHKITQKEKDETKSFWQSDEGQPEKIVEDVKGFDKLPAPQQGQARHLFSTVVRVAKTALNPRPTLHLAGKVATEVVIPGAALGYNFLADPIEFARTAREVDLQHGAKRVGETLSHPIVSGIEGLHPWWYGEEGELGYFGRVFKSFKGGFNDPIKGASSEAAMKFAGTITEDLKVRFEARVQAELKKFKVEHPDWDLDKFFSSETVVTDLFSGEFGAVKADIRVKLMQQVQEKAKQSFDELKKNNPDMKLDQFNPERMVTQAFEGEFHQLSAGAVVSLEAMVNDAFNAFKDQHPDLNIGDFFNDQAVANLFAGEFAKLAPAAKDFVIATVKRKLQEATLAAVQAAPGVIVGAGAGIARLGANAALDAGRQVGGAVQHVVYHPVDAAKEVGDVARRATKGELTKKELLFGTAVAVVIGGTIVMIVENSKKK